GILCETSLKFNHMLLYESKNQTSERGFGDGRGEACDRDPGGSDSPFRGSDDDGERSDDD
ncbi:MAG TPA: hypothetical protein VIL63_11775, partial [Terriglobales bacterium]